MVVMGVVLDGNWRIDMEKYIRFTTFQPCIITHQEYSQIKKDVEARAIADCSEVGDRVLARLLIEHTFRFEVIKNYADENKI